MATSNAGGIWDLQHPWINNFHGNSDPKYRFRAVPVTGIETTGASLEELVKSRKKFPLAAYFDPIAAVMRDEDQSAIISLVDALDAFSVPNPGLFGVRYEVGAHTGELIGQSIDEAIKRHLENLVSITSWKPSDRPYEEAKEIYHPMIRKGALEFCDEIAISNFKVAFNIASYNRNRKAVYKAGQKKKRLEIYIAAIKKAIVGAKNVIKSTSAIYAGMGGLKVIGRPLQIGLGLPYLAVMGIELAVLSAMYAEQGRAQADKWITEQHIAYLQYRYQTHNIPAVLNAIGQNESSTLNATKYISGHTQLNLYSYATMIRENASLTLALMSYIVSDLGKSVTKVNFDEFAKRFNKIIRQAQGEGIYNENTRSFLESITKKDFLAKLWEISLKTLKLNVSSLHDFPALRDASKPLAEYQGLPEIITDMPQMSDIMKGEIIKKHKGSIAIFTIKKNRQNPRHVVRIPLQLLGHHAKEKNVPTYCVAEAPLLNHVSLYKNSFRSRIGNGLDVLYSVPLHAIKAFSEAESYIRSLNVAMVPAQVMQERLYSRAQKVSEGDEHSRQVLTVAYEAIGHLKKERTSTYNFLREYIPTPIVPGIPVFSLFGVVDSCRREIGGFLQVILSYRTRLDIPAQPEDINALK